MIRQEHFRPARGWMVNEGLESQETSLLQATRNYGGGGQQSSSGSSAFSRKGTTLTGRTFDVPNFLQGLITSSANESTVGTDVSSAQNNFLRGLLTTSAGSAAPNQSSLDQILSMVGNSFDGKTSLQNIASRDPYSTAYETATTAAYQDRVAQAMAQAQTGPDAVRGGTGRSAIATAEVANLAARDRGEEIRRAQTQDAGLVAGAAKTLADIEMARLGMITNAQNNKAQQQLEGEKTRVAASNSVDNKRGANSNILGNALRFLGGEKQTVTEDLSGVGNQNASSSGWSSGITCCFIFLEALNGELPWYVRKARDEYVTNDSRKGYNRMSKYLIPAMRKFKLVRNAVNALIVKPLLVHGKALYAPAGLLDEIKFFLTLPVFFFWRVVWTLIGKCVGETEVHNG